MNHDTTLTSEERERRVSLMDHAMRTIMDAVPAEQEDENSLVMHYNDFFVQITLSALHPLIMLHFVRPIHRALLKRDYEHINSINSKSVLGGHAIDADVECYVCRVTQWLDAEVTVERFRELLLRGYDEAQRAFSELFGKKVSQS